MRLLWSIQSVIVRRREFLSRPIGRYIVSIQSARRYSGDDKLPDSSSSVEWRKTKLDQLEQKFINNPTITIKNDAELQPEWKSMESRVTNRRTLTKEELGGKTGRSNIRQTEEDVWLESGLYHTNEDNKKG